MIKVYAGFISMGSRSSEQVHMLRKIEEKYVDKVKIVYPEKLVYRMFHDFARNSVVEDFLKTDCDVLWFLDADISPPENILDLITDNYDKWKLAGAPYPVFMSQPGETFRQVCFTVYRGVIDGKGLGAVTSIPKEGTDFVDGVATGCMFIKREVFDALKKPYFEHVTNPENKKIEMGEDLYFCNKTYNAGFKFFIDYSMVCKHFKEVDLLEVNNYAIDFANKSIDAFNQSLQSQFAKQLLYKKFGRKEASSTSPLISL